MMTDDPAWALAQHVCRTSYADLPASAIEFARRDILDTYAALVAIGRLETLADARELMTPFTG